MDLQKLIQIIATEETLSLSEKDIVCIENEMNWKFPPEYRDFLMATDGGFGEIGSFYIDFWNINDIAFYAEDVETLDGLIPFASDGCGIAFAFDREGEGVLSIPMDCLLRNCAKVIAKDFNDFLDKIENQELVY